MSITEESVLRKQPAKGWIIAMISHIARQVSRETLLLSKDQRRRRAAVLTLDFLFS
jgi:hypothetical protein